MGPKDWKLILNLILINVIVFFYVYNLDAIYLNNLLLLLSLLLIPSVLNYLEIKLNFGVSKKLHGILIFIYLAIQFTLLNFVNDRNKQINDLENVIINKNKILSSVRDINDSSLNLIELDSIWENVNSNKELKPEFELVNKTFYTRLLNNAKYFIDEGDYESAIEYLRSLIEHKLSNGEVYFLLASSYLAIENKVEAILNFEMSANLGNSKAAGIYENLNPIKKRITGYVTLCCDGSYSYSTGRGTCSWHGGVCQWNYPIYENYREY
jgi:tetratricopeptide (TPR) repeat protein